MKKYFNEKFITKQQQRVRSLLNQRACIILLLICLILVPLMPYYVWIEWNKDIYRPPIPLTHNQLRSEYTLDKTFLNVSWNILVKISLMKLRNINGLYGKTKKVYHQYVCLVSLRLMLASCCFCRTISVSYHQKGWQLCCHLFWC